MNYDDMSIDDFIIKLEKHNTKDIQDQHVNGSLTVIWRDWDQIIESPKMVYVSSVNSKEIKGPHLHTKRNSFFTCIHGKVIFILKTGIDEYLEIESNSEEPIMIKVPKNIPSAHINIDQNVSRILTLTDVAWKPNDNEMKNVTFDNYDWNKWNNL